MTRLFAGSLLIALGVGLGLGVAVTWTRYRDDRPWWQQPLTGDEHRKIHATWRERGLDVRTGRRTRPPLDRPFGIGEAV